MADNASAFTIKELGGKKRLLMFQGRALPYRPFKLAGTMRAEFTYYPGNPIGTVQVLGASEEDTGITGIWKDRFLRRADDDNNAVEADGAVWYDNGEGNANWLADVEAIVNAVDDFRMQGQLLEVTWDTRIRQGILKKFTQTWQRHEICEWEMDFGWISRGEAQLPINFASQTSFSTMKFSFGDALSSLLDLVNEGANVWASYAAKVASYVNMISDTVDSIDDTLTSFVDTAQTFADSAHRALAILQTIKEDAVGLFDTVQGTPAAMLSATADIADVTFGDVLEIGNWNRQVSSEAQKILGLAAEQEAALLASLEEQEILDVFDARQDTDLRDVSQQYYGTPDQWKSLLAYNGLASSKLTAGMEILIPKLRTGGTA